MKVRLKLYSRSLDVPDTGDQHPDPVLGVPGRGEAGQGHGPHHGEGEHGGTLDHGSAAQLGLCNFVTLQLYDFTTHTGTRLVTAWCCAVVSW